MIKRLFILLCLIVLSAHASAAVNVIPKPVSEEERAGFFTVNSDTKILYPNKNDDAKRSAELLAAAIKQRCGLTLKVEAFRRQKPDNAIRLIAASGDSSAPEGYTLDVDSNSIRITGQDAGLFYGMQTLCQLLPLDGQAPGRIPCTHIADEPRFGWRGLLFDSCRHFFPVNYIKGVIDEMAYYKLNILHWHLTDDQGWRIEIKKYPLLTEIGSWRDGTQIGPSRTKDVDTIRYGGYYTQEEIREVVAYAASRHIEVVPEFEMPGHFVAAITAYNHLACFPQSFETGGPFEVRKVWGVSKDLCCAGKESTFEFIEDVLTEMMELFPSQYFHVGGDEAPHAAWEQCPACQQRMKDEGLTTTAQLQNYFIERIDAFVTSKGKKMIGWEEIMEGGLSPNAIIMSWLGTSSGVKAAQSGHYAIMCPYSHMYFDAYYASPDTEPLAIGYYTPFEKTYNFEPVHPDLTPEQEKYILGVQGNMWAEFTANKQVWDYLLYPRICALSEIAWSPREAKNWNDFKGRLIHEMGRFRAEGIGYRIPTPEAPSSVFVKAGETLSIGNSWTIGQIRYTTDGTEPTPQSALYTGPIAPTPGIVVRSAVFLPDGRRSSVVNTIVKEKSPRENWQQ